MSDNGTFVNSPNPMNIVNMYYNSSTSSVSVSASNVTIVDALAGDDGAWFDYIVGDASTSARAGTVMAITINSVVQYIDTATADIGNTSPLTFDVVLSGTSLRLRATAASGTWYVTSAVRSNKF
jgi:hypothetical protein